MRYQTATTLTPRQALNQAITDFGPGGGRAEARPRPISAWSSRGCGGHIAVPVQPDIETTVALETREWD